MKSRQKTLLTNIAIYVVIVLIAGFNLYYWRTHVSKTKIAIADLKSNLEKLQKEKTAKAAELEQTNSRKASYEAETDRRRKELESYGDFLRKLSEKPDSIEQLQKLIEGEEIEIRKATFNPPTRGEGANYFTFNFTMELEGSYKSFKQILYKLPKQPQIFRIQSFDVLNFDNSRHHWEVKMQLETYFSGQN